MTNLKDKLAASVRKAKAGSQVTAKAVTKPVTRAVKSPRARVSAAVKPMSGTEPGLNVKPSRAPAPVKPSPVVKPTSAAAVVQPSPDIKPRPMPASGVQTRVSRNTLSLVPGAFAVPDRVWPD